MDESEKQYFRVMICDQFVDVDAETEDGAIDIVLRQIKNDQHKLAIIVWPTGIKQAQNEPGP